MQWNRIKEALHGEPSDLVEVYFYDLDHKSWARLFNWIEGKLFLLDCQFGRLKKNELDLRSFLDGEMSYIAHIRTPDELELSLSIIEMEELTIDIEICEINTEQKFNKFLKNVIAIAEEVGCTHYIVCPEFKKEEVFVINGVVV